MDRLGTECIDYGEARADNRIKETGIRRLQVVHKLALRNL